MGKTPSKHQRTLPEYIPTNRKHIYQTNVRNFATWEHGEVLVSNDPSRLATGGMQNLDRHKQLISPSLPTKYNVNKSRSVENLLSVPTVVTAHQLLYGSSGEISRSKSPSELSVQSDQSSTSSTKQRRKKVPRDLTFVLINPQELQNPREIGKGNFGTVYHALYQGTTQVAIKTLHVQDNPTAVKGPAVDQNESMRVLLHEAHIMTRLKHPNVLRFLGVTFFTDERQLSLVTDFMKNGSLLDYLRKKKESFLKSDPGIISKKLNSFARQIFEAMAYLEERRIIHRDLAARNCLIGENNTLKVADFGLTTLTDCGLYTGTYRTICAPRWTSPEALLQSKYSSRSDVWSYGITLWEIYSLGDRPFGNKSNYAVKIILKKASENLSEHLPKPDQFASDATYTHIILLCLTYNVTMRPRFKDLKERINTILADLSQ